MAENPIDPDEQSSINDRVASLCEWYLMDLLGDKSPKIEDYVPANMEADVVPALVEMDYLFRAKDAGGISIEDYEKRFPEQASAIRNQLEEIQKQSLEDSFDQSMDQTVLGNQNSLAKKVKSKADDRPEVELSGDVVFVKSDFDSKAHNPKLQAKNSLDPSLRFGDYELINEIARGGMGVVYKARQINVDRIVALKMISRGELANQEEINRFQTEAEAAGKLDHPGIVPIFDVGEIAGRHYFSMGYVEGTSLAFHVVEQNFSPEQSAAIVKKIANAISYAHEQGVIHRDLKPANILMDKNDEPRVTDFGLAKKVEAGSDLTATGQVLGTPSYMPPEQAAGQMELVNESADVYSLGAVLYALLCGRPPFQSFNPLTTLMEVLEKDPVPVRQLNPKASKDLETICLKCLEKKPHQRYESARHLSEELHRFLSGEPILARPISTPSRIMKWCQRRPLVAGLISAVFLSLIAGISFSTYYAVLAQDRAERAQKGTRIAVNTLEKVIYNFQDKLSVIPQAREIRKQLLLDARKDLDEISGEFLSQDRVDLDSAVIVRRLGKIFMEVGADSDTSAFEAAEKYYLQAYKMMEKIYQADPTHLKTRNEFADTCERIADIYMETGRPNEAAKFSERHLALYETSYKENSDDTATQFAYSWALAIRGDVYAMQGQIAEAKNLYEKAVNLTQPLYDSKPDTPGYGRRHARCVEKLGDAFLDLGQMEKAKKYYELSHDIFKSIYEIDPENIFDQYNYSTACERMGDYYFRNGKLEKALEFYLEEERVSVQSIETDPKSQEVKVDLCNAYLKLGKTYMRMKAIAKAAEVYEKEYLLRKEIAQIDPNNSRAQQKMNGSRQRWESVRAQAKKSN